MSGVGFGCRFMPLDADAAPSGALHPVASLTDCQRLHARTDGRFDLVNGAPDHPPSVFHVLSAEGRPVSSVPLPFNGASRADQVRVFPDGDADVFAMAQPDSDHLFVRIYSSDGHLASPGTASDTVFAYLFAMLAVTPSGYLATGFTAVRPDPDVTVSTVPFDFHGHPTGPRRDIGHASEGSGAGFDPHGFDLAYASGDVLLAAAVDPPEGDPRLDLTVLTTDGEVRRSEITIAQRRGIYRPRVIATPAGATVLFEARADDGSYQLYSLGLTCLR